MESKEQSARSRVTKDLTAAIFKHFEVSGQSDEDMMDLLSKLKVKELSVDQLIVIFYLTVGVSID